MDEGCYLGEIRLFAGTYAPANWDFCNGQIINVSDNPQLFAVIGMVYGGGSNTFQLPNLNDRVAVCMGQGLGLSNYNLGQQVGNLTVTMQASQVPSHSHTVQCNGTASNANTPLNNFPAIGQLVKDTNIPIDMLYASTTDSTQMAAAMIAPGGGVPNPTSISIGQPSLVLNYIICTYGLFPERPQ